MDVTKTPPPGFAPAGAPSDTGARSAETGARLMPGVAASADRADIRPLDIPAALRIFLAEVRASFELTALTMGDDLGSAAGAPPLADAPASAARAILEVFLQSIPENSSSVALWAAAATQSQNSLQAALDRAASAVSAWRDVPSMVVDAAKETHALVASMLSEDLENAAWLRPEWAGLAPRLEKFRRRRRFIRRHLSDPDYLQRRFDDDQEHER